MPLWHQLANKAAGGHIASPIDSGDSLSRKTVRVQVFSDAARDCTVQRNSQVGAAQFGRPRKLLAIPPRRRVFPAVWRRLLWVVLLLLVASTGEPPPGRKGSRRLCCVPGARSTICRDCESGCKTGTTSFTTIWRFNSPRDCRPCRRYGRSCRMAATRRLERTR